VGREGGGWEKVRRHFSHTSYDPDSPTFRVLRSASAREVTPKGLSKWIRKLSPMSDREELLQRSRGLCADHVETMGRTTPERHARGPVSEKWGMGQGTERRLHGLFSMRKVGALVRYSGTVGLAEEGGRQTPMGFSRDSAIHATAGLGAPRHKYRGRGTPR